MELFWKKTKGSITVLVTLILVPTVFFTGFLVDLARLKLYGNQAVMTADNYGETVLSLYDNLLKELYGLFAVTQDTEALKRLDELQAYMKSSFKPSENTISWEYLQAVLGTTSYNGFMPYQSAEVLLDYEFAENADLRNAEVFSTQIGDFMKFRIAQLLLGDGAELLDAVAEIQNMEDNAKAIDKKLEMDKKAEEIYEAAQEFYVALKDFTEYPDYIRGINMAYSACDTDFSIISGSESYQIYYDYETCDQDAMTAAVEKRDQIAEREEAEETTETNVEEETGVDSETEEEETISAEEQALLDIYDAYMGDGEARRDVLEGKFDSAIARITTSEKRDPIHFENFESKLEILWNKAKSVKNKGEDLQSLKAQLEEILKDGNISEELKAGVQEDLARMELLFDQLDDYTGIASFIENNDKSINSDYKQQVSEILERLEEIKGAWLDCEEEITDWVDSLEESKWKDFQENVAYKKLYKALEECFGQESAEQEGKKKKKEAETLLNKSKEELEKGEDTSARDIPESFGYGKSWGAGGFDLANMVGEAAGYFSMNNFMEAANKLILKLYMVEYDFGMFSSRTTNVKKGAEEGGTDEKKEVSLTGYEKMASINYLYQAELEYILGGANSSKDNLTAARNKILAFRAIVNFTATYSVKEVNRAIQVISDGAAAINPILGLVVNGALRLGVAGAETAADWKELKEGEGVVLIKTKVEQLTSYDKLKGLLGLTGEKGDDSSFKMDYDQYLMVMLIFLTSSDEVAERTANLIELNVNTVQQKIGSSGTLSELKFKLEDAHTAVNATCIVHLDFVVMPKGFAKSVATPKDYESLIEFEKNSYKFTVTRGY